MSRFPTADHLAAWAGVAPGNNESAGKRYSGTARKGDWALKVTLIQAAHAASHTRNTYLSLSTIALAGKRGKKRAILAVAHSILVIAYRLIRRRSALRAVGAPVEIPPDDGALDSHLASRPITAIR